MADKGEYIPTGSELIEHLKRYYVAPDGLLERMLENKDKEFVSNSLEQDDRLAACLAVLTYNTAGLPPRQHDDRLSACLAVLCRDCPPDVFREVAFPLPTRESMGVRH